MEVLIQVPVFKRIMRGFLRRRDRRTQMLQLRRKAHAHLKRICHHLVGVDTGSNGRKSAETEALILRRLSDWQKKAASHCEPRI